MRVSVVVPAYNVERYVAQCLDSILAQKGVETEVIVVNDGSTDGTGEIVEEYARRHSAISVITIGRSGQSIARNTGIRMATAEWIAFVDSDDCLMPGALAYLAELACENDADIAMGRFVVLEEKVAVGNMSDNIEVMSGSDAASQMLYQKYRTGSLNPSSWGKIYRRDIWWNASFPRGKYYEDLALLPVITAGVARVAVSDRTVYGYRCNHDGIMGSFSAKHYDAVVVTRYLKAYFRNDEAIAAAARSRHFSAAFNIMLRIRASNLCLPEISHQCRSIVRRLARAELADSHSRAKNRMGAVLQYFPFLLRSRWLCRKLLTR